MSFLHYMQDAIDGTVGLFSPRAGIIRKNLRAYQRRGYDAANTYKAGGVWSPAKSTINEEIKTSRAEVTARMRQLTRDFPPVIRAVKGVQDDIVGSGLKLQMGLKNLSGDLEQDMNQKIEDDFAEWCENADLAGKLHYNTLERMAVRQTLAEAGECLIIKHYPRNKKLLIPFQIQCIETDWLDNTQDTYVAKKSDGVTVSQGIKYNTQTGEIISYFLKDQATAYGYYSGDVSEVPASSVIHYMHPERFGQIRGISPFTSGMQIANSFGNYFDAEADRAQIAARQLASVESEMAAAIPGLSTNSNNENQIEFEGTTIQYLNPGESIKFNQTPNIGANFDSFIQTLQRWIGLSTSQPYHRIANDVKGFNYTALRMATNEHLKTVEADYAEHIRQFSTPIIREFFRISALSNNPNFRGYFQEPRRFHKAVSWQGPGRPELDPLKESKANVEDLKNGLRSFQEIITARGGDPDKVIREIKQYKELLEAAGIIVDFGNTSTASQGNPAAVEGQA